MALGAELVEGGDGVEDELLALAAERDAIFDAKSAEYAAQREAPLA